MNGPCTAATRIIRTLIGATAQRERHSKAERLGGLEVDGQLDFADCCRCSGFAAAGQDLAPQDGSETSEHKARRAGH